VQLAFNPLKSHILYASFRRRDEIYSWDLRGSTMTPFETFRCGDGSRLETNQKMKFDIDFGGNLMGIGDQVSASKLPGTILTGIPFGIEWEPQYV
jgi:hypothetical protein